MWQIMGLLDKFKKRNDSSQEKEESESIWYVKDGEQEKKPSKKQEPKIGKILLETKSGLYYGGA